MTYTFYSRILAPFRQSRRRREIFRNDGDGIDDDNDNGDVVSPPTHDNSPPNSSQFSGYSRKQCTSKSWEKKQAPTDLIMQASDVLASISKRPKPAVPEPREGSDVLFGKTMTRLIKEIQNLICKEMAKIECHQLLFR